MNMPSIIVGLLIGLTVGSLVVPFAMLWAIRKSTQDREDVNDQTIELMRERNEIDKASSLYLKQIADAANAGRTDR